MSRPVQTNGRPPNVLLIVMDAARAKSLSCYGYQRSTTPNLERFAEHCVVYEKAISPAGWSLPSHASMFTGLYSSRHGAHDEHKYLLPEYPTLAELLRSWGYHTSSFCYNAYVGSNTGLDRGFGEFNRVVLNPIVKRMPPPLRKISQKMDSGVATLLGQRDSGARFINNQLKAAMRRFQAHDLPFFIFAHYSEPHAPYWPPRMYNRYLPQAVSPSEAKRVNQDRWLYFTDPKTMGELDFDILTALYDAELAYLDARIGQLLDWMEAAGILDRTMVIITADHGENIGDHQMMGHAYCLYDTLVHVPLIIHYPKGFVEPKRVDHQVQTLDLLPTILAMLGDTSSDTYRSLQGYDLLSSAKHEFTIAEQARPDLSTFYQRFPGADVSRFDRALKMFRTDRYKYIWASDGDHELYDLQMDPDEQCNILAEHPNLVDELDQRLIEWRNSFEPAAPLDEVPEFEDEVRARLRALGYLE